jgi:hypothetical protein
MLQDLENFILLMLKIEQQTYQLIPFSVYAKEEIAFSSSEEYEATVKYWYDIYKNSVPVVTVPTDNPRPAIRTFKSKY